KPSNIPADRESSPPTPPRPSPHPRTLAAANLPFDLPPSVRARATGSESATRSKVATTTYYPETYEAWGIDTNRHPELAEEPKEETVRPKKVILERRKEFVETKKESTELKKEKTSARSQPTFDTTKPLTIPSEQIAKMENQKERTGTLTQFTARNQQPVHQELPEKPTKEKEFVSAQPRLTILTRQPFNRETTKIAHSTTTEPASNWVTQTPRHSVEPGGSARTPPQRAIFHQKSHPVIESNSRETVVKLQPLAVNPRPRTDVPREPQEPQPAAGNWPAQTITRPTQPQVKTFVEDSGADLDRNEVPRQYSAATHPRSYAMNSISSYNPQQNNNLAGLSPPVDPTYFTYNSQHLGAVRNRQFAVNSVPFDKQIMLERNPWLQQNRLPQVRAMTPQIFSSAAQVGLQSDRSVWQGNNQRGTAASGSQGDAKSPQMASTQTATSLFSRTVTSGGGRAQEDTGRNQQAEFLATSKSVVQQTGHVPNENRSNQQNLQQAGQVHQPSKSHENPRQSATVTSERATPSDPRNLQYPPAVKYRTSETHVAYVEENPQPTPRTEFPRRHIENNHMVVTLPEKTSSRVEDDIVKTKAEWVNSRTSTVAEEDVRTSRTQPIPPPSTRTSAQGAANEEFPAGLDRSQDPHLQNWLRFGCAEVSPDRGPPEEMFREFQRHSKEFQNAIPFVNAARSAVEEQKSSVDNSPLDIMDKTLYLKQEGSVINAPPVRVPDKRPRKLQELSEQFTTRDNEIPVFLRAPPPNSTRTQAPQHTLNQANPIHDLPYDNFPKHMQVVNNTFTDLNTNRRQNDQRPNLPNST
ncbi:hypothetical protein ANCDUO_12535, partial [Ancylostoma duodenale]